MPNDKNEAELALVAISKDVATIKARADLEDYLLDMLMSRGPAAVVECLRNLSLLAFELDETEETEGATKLTAKCAKGSVVVELFATSDISSVSVTLAQADTRPREPEDPRHTWFYARWERLWSLGDPGDIQALGDADRAVFLIGLLEAEVMNGGLGQYLLNTDGRYVGETKTCLRTIGAERTLQQLSDACDLRDEGESFLDIWELKSERLTELDDAFLASGENLAGLVGDRYHQESGNEDSA